MGIGYHLLAYGQIALGRTPEEDFLFLSQLLSAVLMYLSLFHARLLIGWNLCISHAHSHSCSEFMSEVASPCPEDSTS